MPDYGFEIKNDDGDYLVSDKTVSLTFVKRAININSFSTGVPSPTQGRKNGFGGFSELVYRVTNCNATPVPFFTVPRNDKLYSVNRIRNAGGNSWDIHVVTNAKPYHKGTFTFTGGSYIPSSTGYSESGLLSAIVDNLDEDPVVPSTVSTSTVGAVYLIPKDFAKTFEQWGLDRGGYIALVDKSSATVSGNGSGGYASSNVVPFVMQAFGKGQRFTFRNLCKNNKQLGFSMPRINASATDPTMFESIPTGIFSSLQYNGGDISHRGQSAAYVGSNTTGIPGSYWKNIRRGAARYNYRGNDVLVKQGSLAANSPTNSSLTNSVEYRAGQIKTVNNFSGADTNRDTGEFTITNATSSRGGAVPGIFGIEVNSSGIVVQVTLGNLSTGNVVGDTITVPGSALGGGTNFTFRVASIENNTRVYVTQYGYECIQVGQSLNFSGGNSTWYPIVGKGKNEDLPITLSNGLSDTYDDYFIEVAGNRTSLAVTEADLKSFSTVNYNNSNEADLSDSVGTSTGNRTYNEEHWAPGGKGWEYTGLYVRGWLTSMAFSWGGAYSGTGADLGGKYTADHDITNRDFLALSPFFSYTQRFYDFGENSDITDFYDTETSSAELAAKAATTYHDAVYGAPNTSQTFQPVTPGTPTISIDTDAPTNFDHARQTDTYKSAPYYSPQINGGRGTYFLANMVRNTQHSFFLPRVRNRLQFAGNSIANTGLKHDIVNKGATSYHRIHTSSSAGGIMHNESQMLWMGVNSSFFNSQNATNPRDITSGSGIIFTKDYYASIYNDPDHNVDDVVTNTYPEDNNVRVVPISLTGAKYINYKSSPAYMIKGPLPPASDNIQVSLDIPNWNLSSTASGTVYTGSGPVVQVADLAAYRASPLRTDDAGFEGDNGRSSRYMGFHYIKYDGTGTSPGTFKVTQIITSSSGQYLDITAGSLSNITATSQSTWDTGYGSSTIGANNFRNTYQTTDSGSNYYRSFLTDPGISNTTAGCHLPDFSNLVLNASRANQYANVVIRVDGTNWSGESFTAYATQKIYPPQSWVDSNGTTQREHVKLFVNKGEYCYATDYSVHLTDLSNLNDQTPFPDAPTFRPMNKILGLNRDFDDGLKSNNTAHSRDRPPFIPSLPPLTGMGDHTLKDFIHCYKMSDCNLTKRRFTQKLTLPLVEHDKFTKYFIITPKSLQYVNNFGSTYADVTTKHGFGLGGNYNSSGSTSSKTISLFSEGNFFFNSNMGNTLGYNAEDFTDGNPFGMTGFGSYRAGTQFGDIPRVSGMELKPLATLCAMDYFGADSSTAKCSFTFYEKLNSGSWTEIQSISTNPYCNIFIRNPYPIDGTDAEANDFVEGTAKRHFKVRVTRLAGYPSYKLDSAEAHCTLDMKGYSMDQVFLRKFHINTYEDATNPDAWIHTGFGDVPDSTQAVHRSYIPGVRTAFGSIDNVHGFNTQPFYITKGTNVYDSNWPSSDSTIAPPTLSDRSWRTTYNINNRTPSSVAAYRPLAYSFGYYPVSQAAVGTNGAEVKSRFTNSDYNDEITTVYSTLNDVGSTPWSNTSRASIPTDAWKIRGVENDSTTSQHIADAITGSERGYIKATSGFLDAAGTYTEAIYWDGVVVATNASNPQNPLAEDTVLGDFTYSYNTDDDAPQTTVTHFILKPVRAFGPFIENDEGVVIAAEDNEFDATNIPQLYIFAEPETAPTPHSTDTDGIQIFKADGSTLLFDSRQRILQIGDIEQASFPSRAFTRTPSLKADSWGAKWQNHSSYFWPDQYTTVSGVNTPTNAAYSFNTKIQRTEFHISKDKKKKTWNKYYHETRYWANYKGGISRSASDEFKTGFITVLAGHRYDVGKSNRLGPTNIKIGGDTTKSGGITNFQDATYNTGSETLIAIDTDLYKGSAFLVHIRKATATRLSLDGQDRDGNIDHTDLIETSSGTYVGPTLRFLVGDEILIGRHSGMAAGGRPTGGFRIFDKSVSYNDALSSRNRTIVPNDTAFLAVNPLASDDQTTIWVPDLPGTYHLKTTADGYTEFAVPIVVEAS